MVESVAILNVVFTLLMTGVIWFVQIVHYPLFVQVGAHQFTAYEDHHKRLTTVVVAPLMLMELTASVALVLLPLEPATLSVSYVALVLTLVIWGSTAALQVPLHNKLSFNYSSDLVARLVQSNWIRTICWSLRSLLTVFVLFLVLS